MIDREIRLPDVYSSSIPRDEDIYLFSDIHLKRRWPISIPSIPRCSFLWPRLRGRAAAKVSPAGERHELNLFGKRVSGREITVAFHERAAEDEYRIVW